MAWTKPYMVVVTDKAGRIIKRYDYVLRGPARKRWKALSKTQTDKTVSLWRITEPMECLYWKDNAHHTKHPGV